MTDYIIKKYLRDGGKGRKKAGMLMSFLAFFLNILLFALKYLAGIMSGSIAITADGFNNLADAGACLLSVLGFHTAGMKRTSKFPLGYGKLEYLSGVLISVIVLWIGGDMLCSSIEKIAHPEDVSGSPAVIAILILSIGIKVWMYLSSNKLARIMDSSGIRATAVDSFCDCIATAAILASVIIEETSGFNADGYTGVLVAFCILYAGISSIKESVSPLLCSGLDAQTLDALAEMMSESGKVSGFYEAAVHYCGPEKKLLTVYISCNEPESVIPDLVNRIKHELDMEAFISVSKENCIKKNKTYARVQKYNRDPKT